MTKIIRIVLVFVAILGCKPGNDSFKNGDVDRTEKNSSELPSINTNSLEVVKEKENTEVDSVKLQTLPVKSVEKTISEEIPSCIVDQIQKEEVKSVYAYTFGEQEWVYLVENKTDTDGSSTLYSSDCKEICRYDGNNNVWTVPCASFPTRSDNEKRLYPLQN